MSINTLLCFHEEMSQKEIGLFLNRISDIFHKEGSLMMANLQDIQLTLTGLAKISLQEGDEQNATRLAQCGQKDAELFGLWRYASFVVPLETAVLRKDVEGSLSILHEMLSALLIPWKMEKSPVCKHICRKPADGNFGAQFLPSVLLELENNSQYDFLRAVPEFEELINRFRLKC